MNKKILVVLFAILFFTGLVFFIHTCNSQNEDAYEVHRQCISNEYIKGIDVSYYQGNIDWKIVKESGIDFGFARVSDGVTKVDPKFAQNWTKMKEVGIIRGAYQFFRPNQDPIEQAELFVDIVENAGGFDYYDLPSVIDVEVTGKVPNDKIIENIMIWLDFMEEYTEKKPIIYSGPYFWELNNLGDNFKQYSLWTAHYTKKDECPLIPDPWKDWDFWQFTGSGQVAGVYAIVDINFFDGTRDDLMSFIEGTRIVQPEPLKDAGLDLKDSDYKDINTKEDVKSKDVIIDCNENEGGSCECGVKNTNKNSLHYIIMSIGAVILIKRRRKR